MHFFTDKRKTINDYIGTEKKLKMKLSALFKIFPTLLMNVSKILPRT